MSQQVNNYDMNDTQGGARGSLAIIQAILNRAHVATIVRVVGVRAGGTKGSGFVDVVPLVMQVNAEGKGVKNSILYDLPYFGLRGGASAVLIDPVVGDLGIALCADRDISSVKRERSESTPPTYRAHDAADGMYIGGLLNGEPSEYIYFKNGGGIEVVTPAEFNVKASKIVLDAPVETTSTLESAENITDNTSSGNGETMASMRATYNIHDHLENGKGSNTDSPNQKV